MSKKEKHPVDVCVGKMIRQFRLLRGMTQNDLAFVTGVKFQQIQKYENGVNRVSASRLWDISSVLGVDVESFFTEEISHLQKEINGDVFTIEETLMLLQFYYKIPEKSRRQFFNLVKTLTVKGLNN